MNEELTNDEVEIDLVDLGNVLLDKWRYLLISLIAGAVLLGAYSLFFIAPTYESTAKLYVVSASDDSVVNLSDLNLGTSLTADYEQLMLSYPVLNRVIDRLDLDVTSDELAKAFSLNNPSDTRILEISVTYPSATQSAKIVNELTTLASDFIGDMMEGVPPKVIETGEVPDQKTSPSVSKNTLIGVLIGLVLSCGIVTANMLMDDTIKSEDDVMHYLGIPTLASIPDRKDYVRGDKKKKRKWKFWQSKKKPYSKKKKADTEETK